VYVLPAHGGHAIRSYMPDTKDKLSKRSPSLVLDASIVVEPGSTMTATWPADATESQLSVLEQLASGVSYLGRAGSRIVMSVQATGDIPPDGYHPIGVGADISRDTIELLVPVSPLDFDSIHMTTAELQRKGRTRPPSTRWVTYTAPQPRRRQAVRAQQPKPAILNFVQFAVTGRGRPDITSASLVATLLRAAVTSLAPDVAGLHGHDIGRPRQDNHQHAHYLILNDLGAGSRIDRLVIWVPEGTTGQAVSQISNLTTIWVPEHLRKRLGPSIRVALEAVGSGHDLLPAMTGPSRRWHTLTPITTTRHRGKQPPREFVEDIIRRELMHRSLPSAPGLVTVTPIPDRQVVPAALQARRVYRGRTLGQRRQHFGFHASLEFAVPQSGPILLGSLAHFGLGTLLADE